MTSVKLICLMMVLCDVLSRFWTENRKKDLTVLTPFLMMFSQVPTGFYQKYWKAGQAKVLESGKWRQKHWKLLSCCACCILSRRKLERSCRFLKHSLKQTMFQMRLKGWDVKNLSNRFFMKSEIVDDKKFVLLFILLWQVLPPFSTCVRRAFIHSKPCPSI